MQDARATRYIFTKCTLQNNSTTGNKFLPINCNTQYTAHNDRAHIQLLKPKENGLFSPYTNPKLVF